MAGASASSRRISSARWQRHVPPPIRRAVHVVEIDDRREWPRSMRSRAASLRHGICAKRSFAPAARRGGDRQGEAARRRTEAADQQRGRSGRAAIERNLAEGVRRVSAAPADPDRTQQLARLQHGLRCGPMHEVDDPRGARSHRRRSRSCRHRRAPSASEIIGPAGNAMQMLPPTVAMFQILNEARSARQHEVMRVAAGQSDCEAKSNSAAMVQVAAISTRFCPLSGCGRSAPRRARSGRPSAAAPAAARNKATSRRRATHHPPATVAYRRDPRAASRRR